ncbi:LOW QUALITY PROTEIN: serine carboxypeptidase-like 51 [Jatropha curcas]|uniref:LOW QUALITY PROTEIN: serine carboxypeptidase-like 51 n=1 Tax=Jatropha curcas TaxID=180498 RepID=UPI0018938E98|nr:LOW QUALITY PROTEIN: serine carboxypeptidase-like 51 [Jatropha curcas]
MENVLLPLLFSLSLLFLNPLFHGGIAIAAKTKDGLEEWGYVQVRPKAHMFWWLYKSPYRVKNPSKPWPIILWLQGGPGASGVAIGNFEEIGPLDTNLKPRNSTWLQVADLLFVDNPVGTGFSFVEDLNLLVKSDREAATDLTVLLQKIFNRNKSLQESPLYIVAESYGGKFAVTLALSALKSIEQGKLKLKLGGVALGDSWISPEDFVISWGPLLKDLSRLDTINLKIANRKAQEIKQQIRAGFYFNATNSWNDLEDFISLKSGNVDFYNFLLNSGPDFSSITTSSATTKLSKVILLKKYSRYLNSLRSSPGGSGDSSGGDNFMDNIIRKKLKIIPNDILFDAQSDSVFDEMEGDFMKPRINEVDELLAKGVNVTVYNGQLDLICSTKGTEAWVEKLRWKGIHNFRTKERTPLFCGEGRAYKRVSPNHIRICHFYWILEHGHFVPVDEPCITLKMVRAITQSPALFR